MEILCLADNIANETFVGWEMDDSFVLDSQCPSSEDQADCCGKMSAGKERAVLESQDPTRISPKRFLRIPNERTAIATELDSIAAKDVRGVPNLIAVSLMGPRYKKCPRVSSTVVV